VWFIENHKDVIAVTERMAREMTRSNAGETKDEMRAKYSARASLTNRHGRA